MKIGAIVQARMSSQRFPGKVLNKVAGKPMLQYLLEALCHCNCLSTVVVATSSDETDIPITDYCNRLGVAYHCGPLEDVALRFLETVERYKLEAFVRLSGDSPLLDYRLVDKAAEIFTSGRFDMVTNILKRTFPKGQSVELLDASIFNEVYPKMTELEEREHVTPYFYSHIEGFTIHNFESSKNYGHLQLSVDIPEDMRRFESLVESMDKPHWEYSYEEIVGLLA